jgi:uncharacterized protein with HEPN domain
LQEELAAEKSKLSKLLKSLEKARGYEKGLKVFTFDLPRAFKFAVIMYIILYGGDFGRLFQSVSYEVYCFGCQQIQQ